MIVLRLTLLLLLAQLPGCGGGVSKDFLKRYGALFERVYNDSDWEPLCVHAGPFPFEARGGRERCDRCEDLVTAGLLTRKMIQEEGASIVRFDLTERGSAHYKEDADPDYMDKIRRRYAASGRQEAVPSAQELGKPRLCFGKQRFHSIAEALSPLSVGSSTYISVKIVVEVKDPSPLLWDGSLAPLKLTLPPKPQKEGMPVLYPPQVVTFNIMPGGEDADIDNMRYGKWVNEK